MLFRGCKVGKDSRKLFWDIGEKNMWKTRRIDMSDVYFLSWYWICLLSAMFTLENPSWKPYEYTPYSSQEKFGWTILSHAMYHNVDTHAWLWFSHVHMITFTYMVYVYIYTCHVFVYTWPYICNIWTYTYINSPWIYDLVFHRLAFSLYTASSSWVSTCKHLCNLIATPKVHWANFPHQNLVPFFIV